MLHGVKYADARPGKDAGDYPVYLFDFPPETVVEVIMGCQMAKPLREEITALVKDKYPDSLQDKK
jgi:hypothetical protein